MSQNAKYVQVYCRFLRPNRKIWEAIWKLIEALIIGSGKVVTPICSYSRWKNARWDLPVAEELKKKSTHPEVSATSSSFLPNLSEPRMVHDEGWTSTLVFIGRFVKKLKERNEMWDVRAKHWQLQVMTRHSVVTKFPSIRHPCCNTVLWIVWFPGFIIWSSRGERAPKLNGPRHCHQPEYIRAYPLQIWVLSSCFKSHGAGRFRRVWSRSDR